MNLGFENEIIKIITQKYNFEKTFEDIVNKFENKFSSLDLLKLSFDIEKYFNTGCGLALARIKLLKDMKIKEEWLREYRTKDGKPKYDFKGLYIFLNKNIPFYVGISKGVISRIMQHIKGHSHNNSTLAYNISLINYELKNSEKYKGSRDS